MLVIQPVRDWNYALVEPLLSGFFAADQQDGGPARIESVENPNRPATALKSAGWRI